MLLDRIELAEEIDTPYICLDPETGICDIKGKSYPEDITAFYNEILEWFEEYSFVGKKDLVINMNLVYFNSASQKIYTELFGRLMDVTEFSVTVNWYYEEDDEEILENGKIYENLTGLKFNYIPVE